MTISYQGHSCFLITLTNGTRWATDPYDGSIGLAAPAVEADVTTVSHGHFDHNCIEALTSAGEVLSSAGSYMVGGAEFELIPSFHDEVKGAKRGPNLITVCTTDGMRICHMGDIGAIDDAIISHLHDLDVLMIPVGGVYTLDAHAAAAAVRRIAPRLTIPMHFKVPRLTLNIAPIDEFVTELGNAQFTHTADLLYPTTGGTYILTPKGDVTFSFSEEKVTKKKTPL